METFYVQTNYGYGKWNTESTVYNLADARAKADALRGKANGEYVTRIRRMEVIA